MMTSKEEALHVLKTYTHADGTVEDKPSTRLARALLAVMPVVEAAIAWRRECMSAALLTGLYAIEEKRLADALDALTGKDASK